MRMPSSSTLSRSSSLSLLPLLCYAESPSQLRPQPIVTAVTTSTAFERFQSSLRSLQSAGTVVCHFLSLHLVIPEPDHGNQRLLLSTSQPVGQFGIATEKLGRCA
ncbi:hypothetical protein GGR52DRAFT_51415 [Hypoxylon sp. FL1284]|nr:hypothetical protein GGR52DRAFT_51415 [Hypoxylon sp. FL1284]